MFCGFVAGVGGPRLGGPRRGDVRLCCRTEARGGRTVEMTTGKGDRGEDEAPCFSRRDFMRWSLLAPLGVWMRGDAVHAETEAAPEGAPPIQMLPSGIRYLDFREGEGASPRWGEIVWVYYTTYAVVEGGKLEKLDGSEFRKSPYLFKHGGGFTVKGMEEAVHSMKPGGRRRVVVPPMFGYVGPDLGPLPDWIMTRKKLKSTIREHRNLVVFDIELIKSQKDTDVDFGYYDDMQPTPEQLERWWAGGSLD